jgi:hypothetical protein
MEFDAIAPAATATFAGGLALRPTVPDGSARGRDARSLVPQNPADVLARMMDFSGSVALAELLHTPEPDGPAHPDVEQRAQKLREHVYRRFDALLAQSLRPLTGQRAPRLPTPEELLETITLASGEPGRLPEGEAALRLAKKLGAPLCSAFGTSLRQAQAHLAGLRAELVQDLRALGPRAVRLEHIDAALQRSIQGKLLELVDRMQLAAELTFERACTQACAALPAPFGAEDLAGWCSHEGWIDRFRARCIHAAEALYGHLQRSLEGLLLAAIHAEVVR